jgi:hypothetical protein
VEVLLGMNNLKVSLKHCYGIQFLEKELDFVLSGQKTKAYAIYAPNGLMKTSFSRTFEDLAKGNSPKEERFNRQPTWVVEADGSTLQKEAIYVLKAEIDISSDSPAITNILVDPANKARYDKLLVDLDFLKNKLIRTLQKKSRVKATEVEKSVLDDWGEKDFSSCITMIKAHPISDDLSPYEYATIFDPKSIEVLKSQEFMTKASEFNDRYQELFNQAGTIYQKGIFNPTKAETSFGTLEKQGFFAGGHRVHLKGDPASIDKAELDQKLQVIHASIDGDEALKTLRMSLAKNAQTQALTDLIENLSPTQVEILLDKLKLDNQSSFRKDLWAYYIQSERDAADYLEAYSENKSEIDSIEAAAAQSAPRWTAAVKLFNERFIDMPFALSIANQTQAALGKESAKLKFTFKDGADTRECLRDEVTKLNLSQGEKRALYLLNFIFEVEARKLAHKETLFIIDDIADSFDYKNKHAILQYLADLCDTDYFHQIILTHNFDFFRALANSFVVHRDRCLMANRSSNSISLTKAEGIKNYFINVWKDKVSTDDCILCATIPFTRNLIEYIRSDTDPDYLKLTSLLHWKNDTDQITVGNYLDIYNRLFCTKYDINSTQLAKDLLFTKAQEVCNRATHDGLVLEDKVLLSIAIRMKAEIFLTIQLRTLKGDRNYWCQSSNQFGNLIKEFLSLAPNSPAIVTLEKVSITVSSNIHLNSFMYEPILDLTIEHLIDLYNEICGLTP